MTVHTAYPVAFATDTVYGLGAPVDVPEAIDLLYRLKSRPESQPMQLLVSDRAMAQDWAQVLEHQPVDSCSRIYALSDYAQKELDRRLSHSGGVAVRIPNHPELCAYIRKLGVPFAASSANLRGQAPLISAEHVRATFPDIRIIITGQCSGNPSEVWDMRTIPAQRLR